jgi:hypothetical protein
MPEQSAPLVQLGEARPLTLPVLAAGPPPTERARLERRTRLLAWGGIAWHVAPRTRRLLSPSDDHL